ncbi:MFS transporter [Nonomuraea sp. NPDC050556]|uniref:MFS transporter n=1 Tax=Nonomuraea sp. NPDC050556 TaxID=3364369 RepID=UPI00379774A4
MTSALDEPTVKVGRRWVNSWTAGLFGVAMANYACAQIVLPKHADLIAGTAGKVGLIAWATGVASIVTIIVTLLVGALSDRTTAARGRRQIWVLCGAVLAGVALAGQGLVASAIGFILVWAVVQIGLGAMGAALAAAVPDEVPVEQRAYVSGYMGLAYAIGPLLGIALVSVVITDVPPAYAVLGVLLVLLALPYARSRSVPLRQEERRPLSPVAFLVGIFAPLKHADFAWAWSGRFFIQLSNALAQVFLYFYLQDFVHYPDPELGTLILSGVYTIAVCAVAVPAGKISDRTLKRKRMVWISSLMQGGSGLIFAFLPVFEWNVVGAVLLGLGYGVYASVDQALITQVLPNAEDRGKDLGVIGIANVLPYMLTGVIGGIAIEVFGYPTLMVLVLVTAVIAAVTVAPIKSVK